MNWLILAALGAGAYYLWSSSSSSGQGAGGANAPPPGFQGAPGQFDATVSPGAPAGTNPGNYPVVPTDGSTVPSGVPAGTPQPVATTQGPILAVHSGWADGSSGRPWLIDGTGNPFLG